MNKLFYSKSAHQHSLKFSFKNVKYYTFSGQVHIVLQHINMIARLHLVLLCAQM
jgi:hypothetical protein